MTRVDVGGVCLWTALVGLAVDQGATTWLVGMAITGAVVFLLGHTYTGKGQDS